MSEDVVKYYKFRVDFSDGFRLFGEPAAIPNKVEYVAGVPKYKMGTVLPIPESFWENIQAIRDDKSIPEEKKPNKVHFNKAEMLEYYIKEVPNPNDNIASQIEVLKQVMVDNDTAVSKAKKEVDEANKSVKSAKGKG